MGILTQWDSKVLRLNFVKGLGWARLGSRTQPHYEAPGNLHIREVIITCSKSALAQLIQIQVINSVSDKILKIYTYIKSSSL